MTTQTERALLILRERILKGAYRGGEKLLTVNLAEALEISRTPVRAALSQLAEEGLLDRTAGGSFEVRAFSYADVRDTLILRGTLEGLATRLAATRGAVPEALEEAERIVAELDDCFDTVGDGVDNEGYSRLNLAFHATLPRMADSAVLARELERMMRLPFASPSAFLPMKRSKTWVNRTFFVNQHQHRAILQAIRERDSARAETLAREHARTAMENLEQIWAAAEGRDRSELALITGDYGEPD
ncbi:GntR family transcriptional regulator, vanillate catabolism transcriptional regulator [Palleronia marisminoris]|uniref:HTH-type transcriptional repressor CsiR n=1 Tax=Palleronia marisminoris TaxID=315423 RepID=A0A1Y5TKG3_9RHOB|nr:GntR family transcriptional regulator [Palleronia marisminoris]SFH41509.1 GntR family transcriptional regulator, vanillate catabolism transcriptional regulator [Palleronia marisminoris]SLN66046.1 HTH-type transcriptional repressor CsiR [Palleronia marisminoris]